MKTFAQIDSSAIIAAIRKATPVTTAGKVALENLRKFCSAHPLTATNVLQTIRGLEMCRGDVGLENVIAACKGVMAMEKLMVASTFEMVQAEDPHIFGNVGLEAESVLSQLYQMNADKIMSAIHEGALDKYGTDGEIRKLIAYANAAVADQLRKDDRPVVLGQSNAYLSPIINIAVLQDKPLIYVDGTIFVQGERGKLSSVMSLSDYDIPGDVVKLVDMLSWTRVSTDQPNVLKLATWLADNAEKQLNIKSMSFDLLADYEKAVEINGQVLSFDKALAVLDSNNEQFLAASMVYENAADTVAKIRTIINLLQEYRGALLSTVYATVVAFDNIKYFVIKFDKTYSLVVKRNDIVIENKAYNTAIDLLRDDFIANNVDAFDALQRFYANEIQLESSKINIRVKLATDLADERRAYDNLLHQIEDEQKTLAELGSDANPDKVKELQAMHGKVTEAIDKIDKELQDM